MPETYPADSDLLALAEDPATGVPYIPTGQSPYYVAYRRMLHRLARVAERGNDLRVYPAGGRAVGVYGGRCFVGDQAQAVAPVAGLELDADATTHLYVNAAGDVVASTSGLPADRALFIPLAQAQTDGNTIVTLIDLRGEALWQAQTAALAGITATAAEINAALAGIGPSVTADNLDNLTEGPLATADALHRHLDTTQAVDGLASVRLSNLSADAAASIALELALPNHLPDAVRLQVDPATGMLQQHHLGQTFGLLGVAGPAYLHAGPLTASTTDRPLGVVPIEATVVDVVLSIGINTDSSDPADGVAASVYVNGTALATTNPALLDPDGIGFVSTAQGDGTPAVVKSDGTQDVRRGDVLTVDLTLTANGTITQPPHHVAVLVILRASGAD